MSELLKINVNDHTEKKGGLTYLSWAWAWAEVLKIDPAATWNVIMHGPAGSESPCLWVGETALVMAEVTINGIARGCHLPVMDNRNNAVKNPDARKISDAIMRCMTKAISMHGLGLYIYAGEDLPESDEADNTTDSLVPALKASLAKNDRTLVLKVRTKIQEHITADRPMGVAEEWDFARSKGEEFQAGVWAGLTTPERDYVRETNNNRTMA